MSKTSKKLLKLLQNVALLCYNDYTINARVATVIFVNKYLEGMISMKFIIVGRNIEVTPGLRAAVEEKIGKLDKLFKGEADAYVTFSLERGRFLAEITIRDNGMFYRASELTNDMYASVDSGVAAIERQIRRNKTRLEKRLREGALERAAVPAYAPAEDEAEEEFKIVRNKRFSIQPMSVQEAILQMNLLEHSFYAFRNADEGDVFAVVYKRKDGGYGLIMDAKD